MDAERVRIDVVDQVADVRMVRADKHNGLDWRMFVALNAAIDSLRDSDRVGAIVLSGEGPSFCSGLDVASFMSGDGELAGEGLERAPGEIANRAQRVAYGWRQLPVPVVAALHGASFGGGLQIALAADVRIAAPDSRLSVMEIRYGLIPDMSLSQTLLGLVRDDVARELVYSGRIVEAPEAAAIGLITRIEDDPRGAALALAGEIAERSPAAIRGAKRLLGEAPKLSVEQGLALETELQRRLLEQMRQSG